MMPNSHVRAYLEAYLKRKDPGHAILLTAPWGAGKTHLAQRLMKGKDALYVSLFGVKDSDDIDRAILLRRMNLLDNAWSKGIGRVGAVAWKYLKMPELKPAEFAKLALPGTLVFDDLERTNMPVGELAGYPVGDSIGAKPFHALWDYFAKTTNDTLTAAYPQICRTLFDLLETDLVEFNALLADGKSLQGTSAFRSCKPRT